MQFVRVCRLDLSLQATMSIASPQMLDRVGRPKRRAREQTDLGGRMVVARQEGPQSVSPTGVKTAVRPRGRHLGARMMVGVEVIDRRGAVSDDIVDRNVGGWCAGDVDCQRASMMGCGHIGSTLLLPAWAQAETCERDP